MGVEAARRASKLVDPEEAAEIAGTRHESKGKAKLRKELYRKDGSLVGPLRATRLHCLDCTPTHEDREHSPKEVEDCSGELLYEGRCPLRPYRFGTRPQTAARRGKPT